MEILYMKCETCGKMIDHPYYLGGKTYGYHCYKIAVATKLSLLQEEKNDEWSKKCFSLLNVFEQKRFKDSWNKEFQESILKQWNDFKKLSSKQFDCIISKFTKEEMTQYHLNFIETLNESEFDKNELSIFQQLNCSDAIKDVKNDKRFHNFLKKHFKRAIEKGRKHFIIIENDILFDKIFCEIISETALNDLKNDEDIKILELIEI